MRIFFLFSLFVKITCFVVKPRKSIKNTKVHDIDREAMQLPTLKFLWLILQHVLRKGLQRVRDYGFLCGNAKKLRLQIKLLLGGKRVKNTGNKAMRKVAVCLCPCCHHEMQFAGINRLR